MKKNLIFLATSIFLLGFSFLFNSCGKVEKGCDCEESRFLRKTMLVSGSIIEDHVQTPLEADGACHATFDLKFRWADDDWAYNNPDRPPLSYEFQSLSLIQRVLFFRDYINLHKFYGNLSLFNSLADCCY
jgi:hypothetical protein